MSEEDRRVRKGGSDTILLGIGIVLLLTTCAICCLMIWQFTSVLAIFGAELPSTRIAQRYYPYAFTLTLVVVAVWRLWPRRETRGTAALVASIVLSALLWCACLYATYTPIFQLGRSVG